MENKLTGTEKQIQWAEKIRAELLNAAPAAISRIAEIDAPEAAKTAAAASVDRAIAKINSETRAAWFIDHRCTSPATCVVDRIAMLGRISAEGR